MTRLLLRVVATQSATDPCHYFFFRIDICCQSDGLSLSLGAWTVARLANRYREPD